MSPLSRVVEEAGIFGIRQKRNPAQLQAADFFEESDEVRSEFAKLINAPDAKQISIAPSVSYAIASAARNIPLSARDEVVILKEQFPSHVYSWRRTTSEVGAKLIVVEPPAGGEDRGRTWNEQIIGSINSRTAAVCIPIVHWTDGTRFDVESIARRAREVDAFVIIDGTQSVGALHFDVDLVRPDVLIAAGYKWLMGPYGFALACWSERMLDGVPIEENWIARKGSENFAGLVEYESEYQPGAIRFDVGERSNFISVSMMLAALRQINEWTPQNIQSYCGGITEVAIDEILKLGYLIENISYRSDHLFGIRAPDGYSLDGLHELLASHHIAVSLRGSSIRVSPNVYNVSGDLDLLRETLHSFQPKRHTDCVSKH